MDYMQFREQYERQHPASVPRLEAEINEYPGWTRWAVLAAFICAALVSGVHTVPTVWKSIEVGPIITSDIRNAVSLASLLAIELAILLSAYLMAKGVKLAYAVMVVASSVAIMANLYSVVTAFKKLANGPEATIVGTSATDEGSLVVAVVLGIGAPLIALFTGKMFVDIHRADRVQEARARKLFREASIAWDKEIERAWKKHNPSNSSRVQSSNGQSNGQMTLPTASSLGHTKVPDATERARAHFTEHPEDLNRKPRDLVNDIGVSKSTINNVQRELRGRLTSNGHHDSNGLEESESE